MISNSISRLYYSTGSDYPNIECTFTWYGGDALEIKLVNLNYPSQIYRKAKELLLFIGLYTAYCSLGILGHSGFPLVQCSSTLDIVFLLWLLHMLFSTFALIKSEKLLFCPHFALQLQSEHFSSRFYNNFISAANIHDVVINEVIEDLDIHYMLIVRTKGALFKQKPVITIFNKLRPSLECLQLIYRQLMKVMEPCEDVEHGT